MRMEILQGLCGSVALGRTYGSAHAVPRTTPRTIADKLSITTRRNNVGLTDRCRCLCVLFGCLVPPLRSRTADLLAKQTPRHEQDLDAVRKQTRGHEVAIAHQPWMRSCFEFVALKTGSCLMMDWALVLHRYILRPPYTVCGPVTAACR